MRRSIFENDQETRSSRLEHAGASIRAFVESCGYTEKLKEHQALASWGDILNKRLGPEAAAGAVAEGIEDGVLRVKVSRPAWRQRLSFEVPELMRAMNEQLGGDVVKSIRLR